MSLPRTFKQNLSFSENKKQNIYLTPTISGQNQTHWDLQNHPPHPTPIPFGSYLFIIKHNYVSFMTK